MANRNPEADIARRELDAEMAIIRKKKRDALNLALIPIPGEESSEEEKEPEEPDPEIVVEGDNLGQRAFSAAMQISTNLYKATKSMDKCFKSNARQMVAVASASKAAVVAPPARKRTRWDQEDDKDVKEDGKEARPSPFSYVVGENPEVATDSMGKTVYHARTYIKNRYKIRKTKLLLRELAFTFTNK
jgi:hypothetical protein